MTDSVSLGRRPRQYQIEGSAWLYDRRRAFLTDGFGLGKTAQSIWAAVGPVMVACPATLMGHWVREIHAIYPGAKVCVASGATTVARKTQLNAGFDAGADFYVFNTEVFRTYMHTWFKGLRSLSGAAGDVAVQTLIVDEAHRLRGRTSAQSKGAFEVAKLVPRLYLLTATPVYNQPNDLFAQLRMIDPAKFTSYWDFCDTYLKVMHSPWGPQILGLRKDRALKKVFAGYAMGRTREDVKAQMPSLQETILEIEPDTAWYATYEKMKSTYRDQYDKKLLNTQAVLQALRALTQTPKAQMVAELIQGSCTSDTIVYTYHRDLALALGHLLSVPVVTGAMKPSDRERIARAHDFVVATFPSVSEGLDFSHMKNVVYVEHDWQPGLMEQSLARVYRPTSTHDTVHVYHIIVKRTADSVIYSSYKKRKLTMEEIVAAALVPFNTGASAGELTDVA